MLCAKCPRILHILDSLREGFPLKKAGRQLQTLLLKHYEDEYFLDGLLATNEAQANVFLI